MLRFKPTMLRTKTRNVTHPIHNVTYLPRNVSYLPRNVTLLFENDTEIIREKRRKRLFGALCSRFRSPKHVSGACRKHRYDKLYAAEEQKKNKEENPPAPLKEENKKKKLTQTRARKQTDTRDRCAKSLYRQFFHRDVPSIRKKERQRAP